MSVVGFDFETDRFGPCNLAPAPVCASFCEHEGAKGVVASCEPYFDELIETVLDAELICTTNGAFDMAVILAHLPKLSSKVWDAYSEDRVTDILIREQLLVLADTGDLKFAFAPNGAKMPLVFSQAELEKRYLGIDRTEQKEDDDSWRSNYEGLRGLPASEYPKEAFDYSLQDAEYCVQIARMQEEKAHLLGAQFLNVRAALALYLNSCWGFAIDQHKVEKLLAEMEKRFDEKNFQGMLRAGILRPSQPPRPHKRQLQEALSAASLPAEPMDWSPHKEKLEALGIKFTAPKPSSISETLLRDLVKQVSEANGVAIRLTDGGASGNQQVSFSEEVQVELKGMNPIFDEYIDRNEIAKLVTTELPRMRAGRVHPRYRILVETGRTSSHGNKKTDKNPAYPAVNIQQIDPRVRPAYVPSPGHVLCSIDYSFIELVSAAQKCIDLFGHSVLADKINAGYDPHAYLGAGLARKMDPSYRGEEDNDKNYQAFLSLKKTQKDYFKHWRTLAKPTGLGLPGGLGPKTLVTYAKKTFGVDLVKLTGSMEAAIQLASEMRDEWKQMFPEFEAYFRWVNQDCVDIEWSAVDDKRYQYRSRHGMVRRNCLYTSAANGAALQTDTAEGAKIALFMIAREMYDARVGSCLLGCHQVAFIHDEVILEFPEDDLMHERAFRAAEIMEKGMGTVMKDVKVTANPCLMEFWTKEAEPVFGEDKRLKIWKPR